MEKKYDKFVFDVDGVLTTGRFLYSKDGKQFKEFGPDDNDALKIISKYIEVEFISADLKGFEISKKRIVDDMGYKLTLVSTSDRLKWFEKNCDFKKTIYMADSFKDIQIFNNIGFSISPNNADTYCKNMSNYVTANAGGNRAVSEACFYVLENLLMQNIKDFI